MSFVTTQPEALTAAAGSLAAVGSAMSAQNAAVATPTIGLLPAAADGGVRADRGSVRRPRSAVPSGRRASGGDSPNVRGDVGDIRRFVCSHRGR